MRVGIYASMRNEVANLESWLACTADADVVVLNDTGSTDDSVAIARADGRARVSQLPVKPMLLSNALNIAMSLLPEDVDLTIRLDLDERLQPGWRDALEHQALDGPTILRPWFDHHGLTYRHTRVHSRHGFAWDLPVHEVLICAAGTPTILDVEMTIEHHQDLTKDRSQVLGELQAAHAADPTNPRHLHYLARELTYRGGWAAAIPLLREHVQTADFREQLSESWRLLGDAYVALMDIEDVPTRPYRQAAEVAPDRREGWVALADLCMRQGRWLECSEAAERALAITEKNWHFNMPFAWGAFPWHLAALASWYLDRHNDARAYGERACELEPDNDLYRTNLGFYTGSLISA